MPSEPFALYADIHAVDDHAFVGADEDVFHAVDHAGFHLIAAAGADLNDDVRRAQLELLFVDNVLRAQIDRFAEFFIVALLERRDARFVEQWRTSLTIDPEASTPEALDRLGRSDLERWAGVVRATGFVAE